MTFEWRNIALRMRQLESDVLPLQSLGWRPTNDSHALVARYRNPGTRVRQSRSAHDRGRQLCPLAEQEPGADRPVDARPAPARDAHQPLVPPGRDAGAARPAAHAQPPPAAEPLGTRGRARVAARARRGAAAVAAGGGPERAGLGHAHAQGAAQAAAQAQEEERQRAPLRGRGRGRHGGEIRLHYNIYKPCLSPC